MVIVGACRFALFTDDALDRLNGSLVLAVSAILLRAAAFHWRN
jgi:hypothetical protein